MTHPLPGDVEDGRTVTEFGIAFKMVLDRADIGEPVRMEPTEDERAAAKVVVEENFKVWKETRTDIEWPEWSELRFSDGKVEDSPRYSEYQHEYPWGGIGEPTDHQSIWMYGWTRLGTVAL